MTKDIALDFTINKKTKKLIKSLTKQTVTLAKATEKLSKAMHVNKEHILNYFKCMNELQDRINKNKTFNIKTKIGGEEC